MLKKSAIIVLGSSKSSTYPRGYASGFDSPAALLDEFFEHPGGRLFCWPRRAGHWASIVPQQFFCNLLARLQRARYPW